MSTLSGGRTTWYKRSLNVSWKQTRFWLDTYVSIVGPSVQEFCLPLKTLFCVFCTEILIFFFHWDNNRSLCKLKWMTVINVLIDRTTIIIIIIIILLLLLLLLLLSLLLLLLMFILIHYE